MARERIGTIELIDVENDGTPHCMYARDKEEFEKWMTRYMTEVERSRTGKPRIEGFYRESRKEERYLSPRQLRLLFGERIHALMQNM